MATEKFPKRLNDAYKSKEKWGLGDAVAAKAMNEDVHPVEVFGDRVRAVLAGEYQPELDFQTFWKKMEPLLDVFDHATRLRLILADICEQAGEAEIFEELLCTVIKEDKAQKHQSFRVKRSKKLSAIWAPAILEEWPAEKSVQAFDDLNGNSLEGSNNIPLVSDAADWYWEMQRGEKAFALCTQVLNLDPTHKQSQELHKKITGKEFEPGRKELFYHKESTARLKYLRKHENFCPERRALLEKGLQVRPFEGVFLADVLRYEFREDQESFSVEFEERIKGIESEKALQEVMLYFMSRVQCEKDLKNFSSQVLELAQIFHDKIKKGFDMQKFYRTLLKELSAEGRTGEIMTAIHFGCRREFGNLTREYFSKLLVELHMAPDVFDAWEKQYPEPKGRYGGGDVFKKARYGGPLQPINGQSVGSVTKSY